MPVQVAATGAIVGSVAVAGAAEGGHTAVVRAVDDSGNASRDRAWSRSAVDRTPPALGTLELLREDDGRVIGTIAVDDRSPIVAIQSTTGTLAPADGALGSPHEVLVVRADGRGLAPGRHEIRVRARDVAGTWSGWRAGIVDVPRLLRADGFEHGLGTWLVHGAVTTGRTAALTGRAGLAVHAAGRPAFVEDRSPVGDRTLTVTFLLRIRRLHGTVRVLELAGTTGGAIARRAPTRRDPPARWSLGPVRRAAAPASRWRCGAVALHSASDRGPPAPSRPHRPWTCSASASCAAATRPWRSMRSGPCAAEPSRRGAATSRPPPARQHGGERRSRPSRRSLVTGGCGGDGHAGTVPDPAQAEVNAS